MSTHTLNWDTATDSAACRYLYAGMAAQVEVKLKGMGDAGVHGSPCRNVATLPNLQKSREHKRIMIHREGLERKSFNIARGKNAGMNTLSDLSAQKRRV